MKINSKQSRQITQIAQKYNLELVLFFGLCASNILNFDSGFDIAYLSKKDLSGQKKLI